MEEFRELLLRYGYLNIIDMACILSSFSIGLSKNSKIRDYKDCLDAYFMFNEVDFDYITSFIDNEDIRNTFNSMVDNYNLTSQDLSYIYRIVSTNFGFNCLFDDTVSLLLIQESYNKGLNDPDVIKEKLLDIKVKLDTDIHNLIHFEKRILKHRTF